MANKFYNGVSLPELPEIDLATYPYLYIIDASIATKNLAGIEVEGYLLACCPDPVTIINNDSNILLEIPQNDTKAILYATIVSGEAPGFENFVGKWDVYGQETNYVLSYSHISPLIWANHDIVWPDGWVYMKASEPTTKILYSTGLHPEPPEWDKETYPYGIIIRMRQWSVGDNTLIIDMYAFVGTRSPIYAQWVEEDGLSGYIIVESDESSVDRLQAAYVEHMASPGFEPTNSWEDANVDDPVVELPIGEIQDGNYIIRYELIWTNTDIPKETPDSETIFFKTEEVTPRLYYGPFLAKVHHEQSSMNEDMRGLGIFLYRTYIKGVYVYNQASIVMDRLIYSEEPLVVIDGNLCVPPGTVGLMAILDVTGGVWSDFESNNNTTSEYLVMDDLDTVYVIPEYDLLDEDGNIIRRGSQPSVETQAIVWDISVPKAKEVTIVDEQFGQFIKIGDVITVDQLKQLGLAVELGGQGGLLISPGMFGVELDEESLAETAPVIAWPGLFIIFPYDDYTMTVEGASTYFPEKGTYFLNALAKGINKGFVAFDIPKQVPLFEGEIVCDQNQDNVGYVNVLDVNLPGDLAVGDILLVTFDGIEYTDVVQEHDGSLYFGSSVDINSGTLTFDTRPYLVMTAMFDEDVNLYRCFTLAKDQGTHQIKIVRYMRGTGEPAPELLPREVTVEISKNPIPVGETAQVTIVSDNASAENPTYTYTLTNYTWIDNDTPPATIDENGLITVVGEDSSDNKITVVIKSPATTSYDALRYELEFEIESSSEPDPDPEPDPEPEKTARSLSASIGDSTLEIGETSQISISDNASSDSPSYTYSSSNSSIASVDSSGKVTAAGKGTATITITAPETTNYKSGSATVSVTVSKHPRNIRIEVDKQELNVGEVAQVTVNDNCTGENPTYSFSCGSSNVAQVDSSGKISAIGPGTAKITVTSPETTTFNSGSAQVEITVNEVPVDEDNQLVIDFSNSNWKTANPTKYSVADGTVPFFLSTTFTYEGHQTLRSGGISHGGLSSTVINFNLLQAGSVEFNYTVSSESNCDWLIAILDGSEVVKVSGPLNWTAFSKALDKGDHTLEFRYTKDGSVSNGSDAGAIGYVKFVGIAPPYDMRYLIRDMGKLYTIENNNLVELVGSTLNSALFRARGFKEIPPLSATILSQFSVPQLLFWQDSMSDLPIIRSHVIATPPTQILYTERIDLTDPTITGISNCRVNCEGVLKLFISNDEKATWLIFNGSAWVTAPANSSGMTKEVLEAITTEQWKLLYDTSTALYMKVYFENDWHKVNEIKLNFLNET